MRWFDAKTIELPHRGVPLTTLASIFAHPAAVMVGFSDIP